MKLIIINMRIIFYALIASLFISVSVQDCFAYETEALTDDLKENVFVHSDRDVYVAGENMHLKSYLFNSNNKTESSYIYISLRNENKTVKSIILPAENSYYKGSIYLDDTLSTGYYELVAHTNWMRNWDEELFFRKTIAIVNRFDQVHNTSLIEFADNKSLKVEFIPESQKFINGHYNNVLIKTEGDYNAALHDLWIVNQDNDTILNTKINSYGFAVVKIKPDSASNYYALIDRIDKRYELPKAARGCMLKVEGQEKNKINISILCRDENDQMDWLRIKNDGDVVYEKSIDDSTFNITLDERDVPRGLLYVEAGRHGQDKTTQRFWYYAGNRKSTISVKTGKDIYSQRDKISMAIDATSLNDEFAHLSLSVTKAETINENNVQFDSYIRALNMADAFGYSKSEAVAMFGNMNIEMLNNYLISKYNTVISSNDKNDYLLDYFMETEGIVASGEIIDKKTGKPVSDARIIINTPDTIINLLYANTNGNGRFHFVLPEYFYKKELYFFVDPKTIDNQAEIVIDEKFSDNFNFKARSFNFSQEQLGFISDMQDVVRVNKAYNIDYLDKKPEKKNGKLKPPALFSEINQTYYLKSFMPLDSLHEIAREIIYSWQLRERNGEYASNLTCAATGNRITETPIYFLDGIITYDISEMAHLKSEDLIKIEVHNYEWIYGDMFFPGIIGIFTKNNDYKSILDNRTKTNLFKKSVQLDYVFNSPAYDEDNQNQYSLPDLRTVLYWDDNITLYKGKTEEIIFYSGDLKGKYNISIQGITSGGEPVSINKTVEIK